MSYIDVADIKEYLGVSDTKHDAMLLGLIQSAETFIETYTGRVFDASSNTTRTFDAIRDVMGVTLYFDEDLATFSTVTTNADAAGGGTALTANTDFVTLPRNRTPYYALKMLASSSNSWTYTDDAELGITISGKWGYSTTPPADIIQAMKDIVKNLYRSRSSQQEAGNIVLASGTVITPAEVPKMTLAILDMYRKVL